MKVVKYVAMVNSIHFCQCRRNNFFGDHVTVLKSYMFVVGEDYKNIKINTFKLK